MSRIGVVLTLLAFLCAPALRARGETTSPQTSWRNPFCGGDVVMPWNASADAPATTSVSDRYAVTLFADGRFNVAGKVTLNTSTDAYAVDVPSTDLLREPGKDWSYAEPMLIAFQKPVDVRYAYVDQIGVDGATPAVCPTVVSSVEPFKPNPDRPLETPSLGTGVKPTPANHLQAIGTLSCGRAYTPPSIGSEGPLVGHFGDVARTTVVHVYIDSNGIALRETVERSSGVDGLDDAAIGGVQHSSFKPALFYARRS